MCENRCKGTTIFWIVQIFWQKKFSTIFKSYPKQKVILLIMCDLEF